MTPDETVGSLGYRGELFAHAPRAVVAVAVDIDTLQSWSAGTRQRPARNYVLFKQTALESTASLLDIDSKAHSPSNRATIWP